MGNQFAVNVPDIFSTAQEFIDIRDTSHRIQRGLNDAVGNPLYVAGDDEYGRAFFKNFAPALEAAFSLHDGVESNMDFTATNLHTTGSLYLASDNVNTGIANHLFR
jgi:hypothetical protein